MEKLCFRLKTVWGCCLVHCACGRGRRPERSLWSCPTRVFIAVSVSPRVGSLACPGCPRPPTPHSTIYVQVILSLLPLPTGALDSARPCCWNSPNTLFCWLLCTFESPLFSSWNVLPPFRLMDSELVFKNLFLEGFPDTPASPDTHRVHPSLSHHLRTLDILGLLLSSHCVPGWSPTRLGLRPGSRECLLELFLPKTKLSA